MCTFSDLPRYPTDSIDDPDVRLLFTELGEPRWGHVMRAMKWSSNPPFNPTAASMLLAVPSSLRASAAG